MTKIVVLDGHTLNPGDLSWAGLEALGDCTVHDRTPAEAVPERVHGTPIVLTNKTVLGRACMEQLPDLRYIGVLATGYNVVDVGCAAERGIVVTNVPTYGTESVAQMVFALLLELCHHVQSHSTAVHGGKWSSASDFCFWDHPLVELSGKTMGIVGFGRIGRQVGRIAAAMGMETMAADTLREPAPDIPRFCWAEIADLLAAADVVSLHCPLLPETEGLINRETIALMKPSAFLINTSRGAVVRDAELAEALAQGRIAGAALDVLSEEPPRPDNPLLKAPNCLVTPHIAWATREARQRLMDTAVGNVTAYLAGKPVNVVS